MLCNAGSLYCQLLETLWNVFMPAPQYILLQGSTTGCVPTHAKLMRETPAAQQFKTSAILRLQHAWYKCARMRKLFQEANICCMATHCIASHHILVLQGSNIDGLLIRGKTSAVQDITSIRDWHLRALIQETYKPVEGQPWIATWLKFQGSTTWVCKWDLRTEGETRGNQQFMGSAVKDISCLGDWQINTHTSMCARIGKSPAAGALHLKSVARQRWIASYCLLLQGSTMHIHTCANKPW